MDHMQLHLILPTKRSTGGAHLPYMVVEAANKELQHLSTPSQKQMSIPNSDYHVQTGSEQSA
jgi:hypothetical protein